MLVLLFLSTLLSIVPAAPLPSAHAALPPHSNITTSASQLSTIGGYLSSTLLQMLPTSRRCGGRRKCRGGNSTPPPPPPPPPPTRISQSLLLNRVNVSQYAGEYKLVVEAGWGTSIGIYDVAKPGWRSGVSTTSSASSTCEGSRCGIEVAFRATIPAHLSHSAESLSAAGFIDGVASAKAAMARSTTKLQGFNASMVPGIRVPNEADVTVLAPDVHAHTDSMDWSVIIVAGIAAVALLAVCLLPCCLGMAMSNRY